MSRVFGLVPCALCIVLCLGGCGSPVTVEPKTTAVAAGITKVFGLVTLDKVPLANGQILFTDMEVEPPLVHGAPIVKGRYVVTMTTGSKIVEISARVMSGPPSGDPGSNLKELVPAKYNSESALTVDVGAKNSRGLNFELTTTDTP